MKNFKEKLLFIGYSILMMVLGLKILPIIIKSFSSAKSFIFNFVFTKWNTMALLPKGLLIGLVVVVGIHLIIRLIRWFKNGKIQIIDSIKMNCNNINKNLYKLIKLVCDLLIFVLSAMSFILLTLI